LVALLDADDFYFPDKLAVLITYLDDHPEIGMVSGGTQIVDQNGYPLKQIVNSPGNLELPDLLMGNPYTPSAVLFHRKWIERVGGFDETLRACEDWDLWQRMAFAGCQFAWVERLVVAYRYHQGQMTREADRMRKAILFVLDKFFSQQELPEYLRSYKNKAYASALIHAAAFAYLSEEYDRAECDLAEAIHLNPTLVENNYKRLIELLVGWSYDPRSPEPAGFLQRIILHPPPRQPGLKQQLRRAIADVYLSPLFSSSRENRRVHRWDLFKIILYKPDWLCNRGFLRIIADAWLPVKLK
jgi:hypothetical protein